MLTLFGNLDSGNVHKVQMILHARDVVFRRVDVRQDRGQPRDRRFLAINPLGKVPAVQYDDGDVLTESGALLFHFAHGTSLWPNGVRQQTEVLRWMFFEQYSHEPALAVLRYLKRFTGPTMDQSPRIAELEAKSKSVLDVLDGHLRTSDWIVGSQPTIADYALYPYTRLADEVDLSLSDWPATARWLSRVETLPRFLPVYSDAAAEVIGFEDYFGRS
jgi:glutathione S-transferase